MNPWQIREAPVGWARFMEGNAYLKLNQLDSARAAFMDAARYGEDSGLARLNLGVIATRLQRNAEARQWFELALQSDSTNPDAWNNLGTVYESLGDTAHAITAYEHALWLKPTAADPRHNLAGVHFHLGVGYLKAGVDSLAIVHLERCLSLLETPAVHFDLAIALERQGQLQSALTHVDAALRMDPRMNAAQQFRERLQQELQAAPGGGGPPPDRG
jgi:tetratricopeptide (TPR) repeat protein